MSSESITAVAVVGVGAILPDAPDAASFWANVRGGRYSITDVSPERWDPAFYYDANPKAPDKTYSKIGGWVRDWTWDPLGWKLPIPPRVGEAMDDAQKWAVACTRAALLDYGWPQRPLDGERTAVVLGNAMSGERHYLTSLRIAYPELAHHLDQAPTFQALPDDVRKAVSAEFGELIGQHYPEITEDTMPGELGNCMAGRVANLFDLHGPNFVVDAACASALAALDASVAGLVNHEYDTAIAGGVDRNMGASSFVKFCKIGALSATGTRPFDAGADGFVMGEGAGLFVLKRLADAERDGDRIYAVVRGIGGASDGRGKGITAPNPVGQRLAVQRAWRNAGLSPESCGMIECHGTSTRCVGDVVEVTSNGEAFAGADLPPGSVAIGSAKSNIGHLKAAAGAAGLLKAVMAVHHNELPPSLHVEELNPNIDWAASPFAVNTELRPWDPPTNGVRTAGVSAFGFGGTNFHAVLEEYVPGHVPTDRPKVVAVGADLSTSEAAPKAPLRGALVVGADDAATLQARLREAQAEARAGRVAAPAAPLVADLRAAERVAIDYADADELAAKIEQAIAAFSQPASWKALRGRGIFRGSGPAPKVAFLYTGQGSQYPNMLATLRDIEPIVAETFEEADTIMAPLIDRPLTSYLFVDGSDADAIAAADADLRRTEITQPAVLSVDLALTRLLGAYGVVPDLVMGHSLGEYGALVAAGALSFSAALEAVSARGREMANLSIGDNGAMAAVFAPLAEIERIVAETDGYVVIANVNSTAQAVIGGATKAVDAAVEKFQQSDFQTAMLPVSHAFHTSIVAPASEPLRRTLERLELRAPEIPIVANVTGALYPTGPDVVPEMLDLLAAQVASPVQFVQGLRTLYEQGARVFVEVGPKKALQGFAADVLGDDVVALATNHPKLGDTTAFNQALCGLYAAGLGVNAADSLPLQLADTAPAPARADRVDDAAPAAEPVVITGAALGLPGAAHVFDDANVARILHGEQGIDVIPTRIRQEMLDKHITRLVKGEGGGRFETIDSPADVIKLAGRAGEFDLGAEFGVDSNRIPALGRETQLAIGAGLDALRDAGIPLVQHYRTTSVGSRLPDRWMLPKDLRDNTGIVFASAFPGYNDLADELTRFGVDSSRRQQLATLIEVRAKVAADDGEGTALAEIDRRIHDLQLVLEQDPYTFDRRFLFRVLSMGHSQFAELIGARGPNTQVNAACASTTQAIAVAEDWIRAGRCQRVLVVAADDVTSDNLLGWMGAGFLASGAAATDEDVTEAAVPFDRRRHGMILGMGAAAIVVESAGAARQRGIRPICEVVGAVTANSAFHGTRLDVDHIGGVMESVVAQAEARGARREDIAAATVFISHETYTPARGGSAAAEVNALRRVFGDAADQVVVANTKGFTGHPMGVGIEDVVAVKALETGIVPPVPNFKEPDPDLGPLNLSIGGVYPVRYALRLAAGFGSQISMIMLRWVPTPDGRRPSPDDLGFAGRIADAAAWQAWLARVSGDDDPLLEVDHRTLRVAIPGAVEPIAPTPQSGEDPSQPEIWEESVATADTDLPQIVEEDLAVRVVALVAEQTGYPPELLDLDLDLEADLGIDTVKQAELFAQVRETYGIARDDTLKLRDYPTLNHVIGFVRDRTPQTVPATTPAAPTAATESGGSSAAAPVVVVPEPPGEDLAVRVVALVAEQTGYPPELLDLDLDLEADLGIDTVKQAELFAQVRETYGIARDDTLKLRDYPTLNHVIGFVRDRTPTAPQSGEDPSQPEIRGESVATADTDLPQIVEEDLAVRVVALVAEQTGYPPELLDLDLDLEADLGIDTVKQAELFAQVRETYGIARDDSLKLRDYPTLNHVIGFVRDRTPTAPQSGEDPSQTEIRGESVATADTDLPQIVDEDLAVRVVALVAEQTGYPPELLDLDLDLEADLGIDTVKQAELFAQVRETYGIDRDDTLKLRDYPTLNHVIGFVRDRTPTAPQPGEDPSQTEIRGESVATADTDLPQIVEEEVDDVGFPRRAPVAVVRPPLDWFAPTGVQLAAGSRVVVLSDTGGVAEALAAQLADRGVEVLSVDMTTNSESLVEQLTEWLAAGPIEGLFALAALDNERPIADLDIDWWQDGLRRRVKLLAAAARVFYDRLDEAGSFIVSATRNGGAHGYDASGARSAMAGAVSGFTKALARERPTAIVKVVDVETDAGADDVADALLDETLGDAGVVEIGRRGAVRLAIGLEVRPPEPTDPARALTPDSVVVATGAAGSIVSAIVADLARAAGGGTFHLLDLIPEPDPADPDLARFANDRDGLKGDIAARITQRGERATPVLIERELAAIERRCAALAAIEAITSVGGTAHWYAADLRDGEAIGKAASAIRATSERVDVLLHAAGLEISRLLPDKSPAEFDLVFDVKANGWFHLLHALGDVPIGAAVVFSSIAGRFGNGGQTDYSAANDLLCKSVSSFRTTRPETRGIAIDWTAWEGIGMASRGSIPKMMALAGIDMLPPAIGIPVVRREVTANGTGGEIVVAGALGVMVDRPEPRFEPPPSGTGPMVGQVVAAGDDGIVIVTELDPATQPFLDDHRIEGTPVLPGVMGIEAFAEAACLLTPGWGVSAVEDVEFRNPFKWYRDEPRRVEVSVRAVPEGDRVVAVCRLDGRRTLPGHSEQVTTHFVGRVVLSPTSADLGTMTPPAPADGPTVDSDAIYRVYFHGPAYQVLAKAWRAGDVAVGELATDLPANNASGCGPLVAAPRLVESCFQTAGLAELATVGSLGLPRQVRRLQIAPGIAEAAARWAVVTTGEAGVDAVVLDGEGHVLVRLSGYETIALPGAVGTDGTDIVGPIEVALR